MDDPIDFLFWRAQKGSETKALELARRSNLATHLDDRIIQSIRGDNATEFGANPLDPDRPVFVGAQHMDRHNVVVGSTGSGKTRFWLAVTLNKIRNALRRGYRPPRVCLADCKGETATILAACCVDDKEISEGIRGHVHWVVADGSRVTPIAPFRCIEGASAPYVAELRAATFDRGISGQMRLVLYIAFWTMVEIEAPFSFRFVTRFLRDDAYRAWVRERIQDRVLRELIDTIPNFARVTVEAVMRVIIMFLSYPLVRASVSVPPAVLRTMGLPTDADIVIGDFSSCGTVPRSIALSRARWFLVDELVRAAVRDPERHLNIAVEEVSALLAEAEELTDLLVNAYRTLRSRNVSVTSLLQSLEGLPKPVAHEILLNSHWGAFFASGPGAANVLFPHVSVDPGDGRRESERAREFARSVQELKSREFFLWIKTHGVLRLTAPRLDDQSSVNDLMDEFRRDIVPSSTISIAEAERHLAEWERSFVDDVRPGGSTPDFREVLFGGEE